MCRKEGRQDITDIITDISRCLHCRAEAHLGKIFFCRHINSAVFIGRIHKTAAHGERRTAKETDHANALILENMAVPQEHHDLLFTRQATLMHRPVCPCTALQQTANLLHRHDLIISGTCHFFRNKTAFRSINALERRAFSAASWSPYPFEKLACPK